jgi:LmbE family N-acetylglucosaminyl deacetylase
LNKRILVFAPHPDDETFGCGGTIAKRVSEGYDVFVVLITDGEKAFDNFFSETFSLPDTKIIQLRKTEIVNAMRALGVSSDNIIFLNFDDGALNKNFDDASAKISKILEEVKPQEIYFPFEKDAHPDHRVASLILQNCIDKLDFSTKAYMYSISGKSALVNLTFLKMINYLRHKLVVVDVSDFLQQKKAAINEYKSQISKTFNEQDQPVVPNSERFLKKTELFVRY